MTGRLLPELHRAFLVLEVSLELSPPYLACVMAGKTVASPDPFALINENKSHNFPAAVESLSCEARIAHPPTAGKHSVSQQSLKRHRECLPAPALSSSAKTLRTGEMDAPPRRAECLPCGCSSSKMK